ncbi:AMP-binding protein [Zhengella sp. ZM62]|uniref:AMP-binding protein n=1 Tax=Zhengella sedimenti TaxID=3390035 RepID=UPI003975E024
MLAANSLPSRLRNVAERYAEQPAIRAQGHEISYGALISMANTLDRTLQILSNNNTQIRIAIFTNRDVATYSAIYTCLANGYCYIPINPNWPNDRILNVFAQAKPSLVYCSSPDKNKHAMECVRAVQIPIIHMSLDRDPIEFSVTDNIIFQSHNLNNLAYIMFTSGSTGMPKGVPITYDNLLSYADSMIDIYPFSNMEIIAQAVEMTFDLSVHDMVLTWMQGGKLLSIPAGAAQMAPRMIKNSNANHWLTVPSAAAQAKTLGLLKPKTLQSLKTLFFCGEALPESLAITCAQAAPNARIVNLYGPTEATIAFSSYEWGISPNNNETVPLGEPIGNQQMKLSVDGEIMLSGLQLSPGYLNDNQKTKEKFVIEDGTRWYLTGDLGTYDQESGFLFRGRLDSQIKLRGYRVELGEVEGALRQSANTDLVAAVAGSPDAPSSYTRLFGFVSGATFREQEIIFRLREILPTYMIPDRIIFLESMPKNTNDKIDYVYLKELVGKNHDL